MTDRWKQSWTKHRKALTWIGISLGVVGFLLYLAQDPATLRVESPVAASDPRFPHAPVRPVTINNGYQMRAWYEANEPAFLGGEESSSETLKRVVREAATD